MGSGQRRAPSKAYRATGFEDGLLRTTGVSSSISTTSAAAAAGSSNCRRRKDPEANGGAPGAACGSSRHFGGGSNVAEAVRAEERRAQAAAAPAVASPPRLPPLLQGVRSKKASELWHVHGRRFDLTAFLDHHPGGSSILEAMRGAEDITPVFESYHALAHSAAIRQSLEKFEWTGTVVDDVSEREAALVGGGPGNGKRKEPVRYRWEEGGFYAVVTARVKKHFLEKHGRGGMDPRRASVNRFVKAPISWYFKELLILAIYVPLFLSMLGYAGLLLSLGGHDSLSSPLVVLLSSRGSRSAAAFLAGVLLQSFSFCTLHDASHYGLLFKRPRVQEVLSRVCNAWTLWHHGIWVMHHVYGHHSFTGDPERDPDLVHARPYLRKSILAPLEQYDPFLVRWQRILAPLFMMVMPGATLGQTQAYLRGLREGNLWHVSITAASRDTRWYEYLTYALALGAHVLGGDVMVSFCYFMGISVAYHLCVAPDHDTFESSIVNSVESKRKGERERAAGKTSSGGGIQGAVDFVPGECLGGGDGGDGGDGDPAGIPGVRPDANDAISVARARAQPGADEFTPGGDTGSKPAEQVAGAADLAGVMAADQGDDAGVGEVSADEMQKRNLDGDDWGEVQVRHSGNFSNGNPLLTHLMGGINYQIEHHLFPSMSHMLYAEIAPIVRDACAEFSIPYNAHPSLWSAYKSYLKHLVVCSEMAGSP